MRELSLGYLRTIDWFGCLLELCGGYLPFDYWVTVVVELRQLPRRGLPAIPSVLRLRILWRRIFCQRFLYHFGAVHCRRPFYLFRELPK